MRLASTIVTLTAVLFFYGGCGDGSWKVVELQSPAGNETGEPFLFGSNHDLWMSWIAKTNNGHEMKISRWSGEWSAPGTVVSGVPLFVNWADFPSILPLSAKRMVAHWLEKKGEGTYAYFVMTSMSEDQGKTWSRAVPAHTDTSLNEHGFASLMNPQDGGYSISWLDARNMKAGHGSEGAMALMYSTVTANQVRSEWMLDPRVCDCCQTDAAPIRNGFLIAYRDRSEQEIRDISYIRVIGGQRSEPKSLHADGWQIDGCPVNGPAVAANGDRVVIAWYTGAQNRGRVRLAFSNDNGESFAAPMEIDDGNPSGRVDVVLLEDGSAVVSWLENQEGKGAAIRLRQVFSDGRKGEALTVADTSQARTSGFPRMARVGGDLFIAWTFVGDQTRVRVAKIEM